MSATMFLLTEHTVYIDTSGFNTQQAGYTDISNLPPEKIRTHFLGNEMNGVLGHDSAIVRLYWAGDNLG